ncbi:3-isopropylmalate dehydratase small subunit [Morus notabilis]|uniref:3-isopropylmalate dehydratase small subunit n=1 Tax=Morus notabilis TaxID=981085 RepID=W9RQ13_9ROSA|nr:3-isopropylmalate dehydratase small subunit [Morus notabilis]
MAASLSISTNPSFTSSPKIPHTLSPIPHSIKFPATTPQNSIKSLTLRPPRASAVIPRAAASQPSSDGSATFHGVCYVVGDNIDTDQIIPAEYLTLVPSNPAEYEKLGSYALCGLPSSYAARFLEPGETKSKYSIVIGGANFGCGSSREHAPVALGAAGTAAVVAESYARIFFRNSVATGEVYPLESEAPSSSPLLYLASPAVVISPTHRASSLFSLGDPNPHHRHATRAPPSLAPASLALLRRTIVAPNVALISL